MRGSEHQMYISGLRASSRRLSQVVLNRRQLSNDLSGVSGASAKKRGTNIAWPMRDKVLYSRQSPKIPAAQFLHASTHNRFSSSVV
jgi:hypothetical protein